VANAKNATFLFQRDFMEYHKDRFDDYSLLVYKNEKLCALLPANIDKSSVYSHQGLSYGSLIISNKIKFKDTLEAFKIILEYLEKDNLEKLIIKGFPKIYTGTASDELDYLLFLLKAKQIRSEISSTINLSNPFKIQPNRMEGVKKANKIGLEIKESNDFKSFWNKVLTPNLLERFDASPVHSLEEIEMLANRFPKNILQFNVFNKDTIVGGATIFESKNVAHVQYISATNDKQSLGTLDFLFEFLIKERFKFKMYFDFGTSNENQGLNINEGLQYWKECFGARASVNQSFAIETKNHLLLDSFFV